MCTSLHFVYHMYSLYYVTLCICARTHTRAHTHTHVQECVCMYVYRIGKYDYHIENIQLIRQYNVHFCVLFYTLSLKLFLYSPFLCPHSCVMFWRNLMSKCNVCMYAYVCACVCTRAHTHTHMYSYIGTFCKPALVRR